MSEIGLDRPDTQNALLTAEQIDAMPMYEWDVAQLGDAAPPFTYLVTARSIADYCRAVRNENPLYQDADAARRGPFGGIVAPPTYAFKCAPPRRDEVMHARGFVSPEEKGDRSTPYAKSELFFQRPIRPGDEVTSVVSLEDKYERRGNQFMTWRVRATDARGEPVVEYTYTIIWRQAPRDQNVAPRPQPTAAAAPPRVAPEDTLPVVTKAETQEAIDRYSELTQVRPRGFRHNLHTDPQFARRTIFGGTVNMGVATAAYCAEVLERAFGPAALLRPGARLEYKGIRPIRAGYEITLTGRIAVRRPDAYDCEVWVHNQESTLCGVATATVLPT